MARRNYVRWLVIAALALAGAGLLAYLFAPRPLAVDIASVQRGPIAETVSDQGVARVRQGFVISATVSGRLERLPLEVGDPVTAGQTIVARLRPVAASFLDPRARSQAVAAIAAARSQLSAAEAQRGQASAEATRSATELARLTVLAKRGFTSRQALDNAHATAAAAQDALRATKAQVTARAAEVSAAESALTGPDAPRAGEVVITAPVSGVVTHLFQQSERDVAMGTPLIEIGVTHGLEAQIEFLSQDAVRIRPGQRAEIYDWGGRAPIPARVRLVEPQGFTKISALGVEEQRALVMLQLVGPVTGWAGLEPGYRVWGRVYLRESPAALVAPVGALVRDKGGWAVFRIEQGRARLRAIRVGAITDQWAEILGGISLGDQVVEYPSDQVADGIRVAGR